MGVSNGEIEIPVLLVVADASLIQHPIATKEIGLGNFVSEAIEQGFRNSILTVADRINASISLARNLI